MTTARPLRCDALVVSCMDFRLQAALDQWLARTIGYGRYDRVAIAGGVKDQASLLAHVDLAVRLHGVRLVVLLNHEDCGAYGAAGTLARHQADLRAARARILAGHPGLLVACGYMQLDGAFVYVPEDDAAPPQPLDVVVRHALQSPAGEHS